MSSEKLLANLERLIQDLPQAVDRALTEAANSGAALARTQTFYTVRGSSGLREATKALNHGFLEKGIIADKPYASWVNFGNGPPGTKIYPTSAKALHFMLNGQEFYRKWVHTSQPKPFWDNMLKWEKENTAKIIARHVNDLIERL